MTAMRRRRLQSGMTLVTVDDHIRLFRLYPESNGGVGILAGGEIFMTKPHQRGDKALFMGSAAAWVN